MTDETAISAMPAAAAPDRKEDLYTAKPWQLIWRRFTKHTLAVVSLWFLVILALCAVFAEQVAPYDPFKVERLRTLDECCVSLLNRGHGQQDERTGDHTRKHDRSPVGPTFRLR